MVKKPYVSVIMNCFNGEEFLKESIESVINQSYKNWELIFYDNCSTDKSKKIFASFKDKRLKYFKSKKKLKLYNARNLAVKKIKGKFISFIDTDDVWLRDKLKKQLKKLKETKTDFCYSNYFILEKEKLKKAYSKNLPEGIIYDNLLEDYLVGILTVLFDSKLILNNNIKFNNRFDIIGDFELFLELSKNNKFCCIQEPLARYRIHKNNMSIKKFSTYIKELKIWANNNKKKLSKKKLLNFNKSLMHQEIKYHIYKSKYLFAIKKFIAYPASIAKIKLFILFFLPKKYCRI